MLKKIIIVICLITWPLNFILNFHKFHFSTDTVFKNDYQGEQLVLRNIILYPNPPLARLFQNKPRIYLSKYLFNIFTLIDPNYYFFASHPSPIHGGVNITKFPFATIVFFIYGLLRLNKTRYKKWIVFFTTFFIVTLATLVNFEGFDIILWLPIFTIILTGIDRMFKESKKIFNYYFLFFIVFSIPEIVRSFFNL